MPEPKTTKALKGIGEPRGPFLVVDPGKHCGLYISGSAFAYTVELHWLPTELCALVSCMNFVVCEAFSLGSARHNDPKAPAAIGIGMCRTACDWTDTPLYLAPANCKRAGQMALDAAGREARERCRNEHERDAVDITGFVLRTMQQG